LACEADEGRAFSACSDRKVVASLRDAHSKFRRVNKVFWRGSRVNLPLKDNEVSAVGHAEELNLIYGALVALRKGDPSAKLPYQGSAAFSKVSEVFND